MAESASSLGRKWESLVDLGDSEFASSVTDTERSRLRTSCTVSCWLKREPRMRLRRLQAGLNKFFRQALYYFPGRTISVFVHTVVCMITTIQVGSLGLKLGG